MIETTVSITAYTISELKKQSSYPSQNKKDSMERFLNEKRIRIELEVISGFPESESKFETIKL